MPPQDFETRQKQLLSLSKLSLREEHNVGEALFAGPGEMRALCRAYDWTSSQLGPVQGWSVNLRAIVQTVLAHHFPTIVLCGPKLIQIYNDAYRDLMGIKHPRGLGQPTEECWPEVWHINAPIYERVWQGESFALEDALFPITRFGVLENAWFTLSYTPVWDESGVVAGVFLTIFETTRRLQAEQALQRAHRALQQAHDELEARVQERTQKLEHTLKQQRHIEAARDELVRRIVTTQEEERGRISRELHDILGQHLTGVTMGLRSLEMQIESLWPDARAQEFPQLEYLRSQVVELMRVAHDQARELRPAELDTMGLEVALGQCVLDWSRRTGVRAEFQASGWETRPTLEVETTLYRVVQEALTNVARHAMATQVSVILKRHGTYVSAIIEDNGRGFDLGQRTKRLGLLGMQERLAILNGSLDIESSPDTGTTLFARIPLQSSAG
jgi:signal transduction histidine kinase